MAARICRQLALWLGGVPNAGRLPVAIKGELHSEIVRIGDGESDLESRFSPLRHFCSWRSFESAQRVIKLICLFVLGLHIDVCPTDVNRLLCLIQNSYRELHIVL